jgi:hypothetical protein
MARQENSNAVMHNARGMFAKQVVFKERAGKVYLSGPPKKRKNRKPTAPQAVIQDRFKAAVDFAKMVMDEPVLKASYKKVALPGQTAYNIAFKDAFNPPVVQRIFATGYRGVVGDTIIVQAKDDFKVSHVKVAIYNSANELIEEGPCVVVDKRSWGYTVSQANASVSGTTIKATAFDIPENEGSLEVTL